MSKCERNKKKKTKGMRSCVRRMKNVSEKSAKRYPCICKVADFCQEERKRAEEEEKRRQEEAEFEKWKDMMSLEEDSSEANREAEESQGLLEEFVTYIKVPAKN